MTQLANKILSLQQKKEALEQEFFSLKQANVQKLSAALYTLNDIETHDMHLIIGAILETLSSPLPLEKKERLLKAGRNFCRKKRSQINALTTSSKKDTSSKRQTPLDTPKTK